MAAPLHVKVLGKWESVKIDNKLFSEGDFQSLISFEELTDYELIEKSECNSKKQKVKKDRTPKTQLKEKKNKERKEKKKKIQKDKIRENDSSKSIKDKVVIKDNRDKDDNNKVIETEDDKVIQSETVDVDKRDKPTDKQKKKKKAKKRKQKDTGTTSMSKKARLDEDVDIDDKDKISMEDKTKDLMTDMVMWKDLFVPEEVLLALRDNGFTSPTHIQSLVLPHAIRDRLDIVGAAETGSGKTLAFGIPVINKILDFKQQEEITPDINEDEASKSDDGDSINDDITENNTELEEKDVGDEDDNGSLDENSDDISDEDVDDDEESMDNGEGIGCVTVIDNADFSSLGLEESIQNDEQYPLALILEPTRELAIQVRNHLLAVLKYTNIKVATIVGGMSVQKQQRILKRKPEIIVATPGRLWELFQMGNPYLSNIDQIKCLVVDEADRMVEKGHFEELENLCMHINKDDKKRKRRQNFVFSATLTMIHVGPFRPTKKKKVRMTEAMKLEALVEKIGLKDKPKIIDLSRKTGTVETLTEARINCTKEEKDLFLYYFLTQFPGRTLVFANSKDCIRRLMSIFTLLQTCPMQLHADMHQKQRLKNLERFTANPNGLLLASDVAARGLDIPNVQHVIHYQVPMTVENYVHRSGRTARASKEGISVMLVGPDDVKNYRKIIHTLNRNEDLPIIPMEYQLLPPLKQRLNLALKVDTMDHRFEKKKRQNDWFVRAAEEMDLEIDDRLLQNDLGDSVEQSKHKQHIKHLKQELNSLLQQPMTTKTFSGKYPTKTGKLFVPNQPKVKSDVISCVKKDRKSQEKLVEKIQIERTLKQKALQIKKKEKLSNRQRKRKDRKKNKES